MWKNYFLKVTISRQIPSKKSKRRKKKNQNRKLRLTNVNIHFHITHFMMNISLTDKIEISIV